MTTHAMSHSVESATLADVLERVLDKGVVIAGDITIRIADIDLLTIRIRLMIASVDKAKEMGIDWWEHDSSLSWKAREAEREKEIGALMSRVEGLEAARIAAAPMRESAGVPRSQPQSAAQQVGILDAPESHQPA